MNKILVFDMDGTMADLYGVDGWLDDLRAYRTRPYAEARPLVDMDELRTLLLLFKQMGGKVVVTTWLAKEADKAYDDAVRIVKKAWLDMWMFPYDELHMVRYGTTKANCTRRHGNGQTLFDDNAKIRKGWHLGDAVDAVDMMDYIRGLVV